MGSARPPQPLRGLHGRTQGHEQGVPLFRRGNKFTIKGAAFSTGGERHFPRTVVDVAIWHHPPGFRIDVSQALGGAWNLINAGPSWSAEVLDATPSGAWSPSLPVSSQTSTNGSGSPTLCSGATPGPAGGCVTARRC